MSLWKIFYRGLFDENPIFRLALSLCPALAVTTTAVNALGMGLSVLFVITMNNMVVSIFRKYINPKIRVPIFIMSIATIVTVVELILGAFFPALFKALGIYLALVVVFAIILARAEVFASKNKIIPSFFDGLGMGMGFTGAMVLIGCIREFLGYGSIFGFKLLGPWYVKPLIIILPPGGFLIIGILIGIFNIINKRITEAKEKKELEALGEKTL